MHAANKRYVRPGLFALHLQEKLSNHLVQSLPKRAGTEQLRFQELARKADSSRRPGKMLGDVQFIGNSLLKLHFAHSHPQSFACQKCQASLFVQFS